MCGAVSDVVAVSQMGRERVQTRGCTALPTLEMEPSPKDLRLLNLHEIGVEDKQCSCLN